MGSGKLLLLPNLVGEDDQIDRYLPASVARAVASIDGLVAESERGARRFLSRFKLGRPVHQVPVALFDKNRREDREYLDWLLEPVAEGQRWGVASDQGVPCVADPGAALVRRAHQRGFEVVPFVGPCTIIMALMVSGLSGQQFAFRGYIARERKRHLLEMEKAAKRDEATQIFMETPYRNNETLKELVELLSEETYLSVVWNLGSPDTGVKTLLVKRWRKEELPDLTDKPALFLIA
jgi:16S rRNA (cytidine1402-2'-O)-methyltransferase